MVDPKRSAGRAAADLVKSGMRLGFGTGSTFRFALERLAERMQGGLADIVGVPTSEATARLARELGVPTASLDELGELDLAIDGADEVDPHKTLIKGGGGALVREKIIASAAREMVVIVHAGKLADPLGSTFPLPVEVLPFGFSLAQRRIAALGCEPRLRRGAGGEPFVTDNGNYILDCPFAAIPDAAATEAAINAIPGVLDNGLFVGMAGRILVGEDDGSVRVIE